MVIAVVGAAILGKWEEAAIVIVLYTLAEHLEDLGVSGVEQKLVDDRDVLLQSDVVGQPALAAVGTLVHGIAHRAGIDRSGMSGVDGQREDAARTQFRGDAFPGGTPVACLVDRFIGRYIQDVGIGRVESDRHDAVALFPARGKAENQDREEERWEAQTSRPPSLAV